MRAQILKNALPHQIISDFVNAYSCFAGSGLTVRINSFVPRIVNYLQDSCWYITQAHYLSDPEKPQTNPYLGFRLS